MYCKCNSLFLKKFLKLTLFVVLGVMTCSNSVAAVAVAVVVVVVVAAVAVAAAVVVVVVAVVLVKSSENIE